MHGEIESGMRKIVVFLALVAACRPASNPTPATGELPYQETRFGAVGSHGMVASDAPLASRVGVEIMKAGGNAVDAAVAVGFALAVVYPEAGNLGGGGFTLVRMADGRVASVDFREIAPLAATRNMFLDDSGRLMKKSEVGPLASGVPGSVAGLVATHEKFGALLLARVLAPAIRLAEQGFEVDSALSKSDSTFAASIQYGGGALFGPGGKALAVGTTLRQPALARTLRAIADSGASAFYTGAIARDMVADLRAAGSIITAEDLARYKPEWREPLRATYRGHTIVTVPPPSSGVTMIETLNILEGFAPFPPFGSTRSSHLLASALQRAFIDRNSQLGDPAFVKAPVDHLADKSYAAKLRASIRDQYTPTPAITTTLREGQHTTHYAVVDAAGNAVSTTTTLNDLYGSGVYLATVGIFMNDEMDDFAANPGQPNMFGLVQGEQNAIQPGKRMLSSMLPTIVLDRVGRPLLVVGARGGPRIISAVTQVIVNVIDHHMAISDAISGPRLHHQALPDTLRYEKDFPRGTLDSLRMIGYALKEGGVASANAILRVAGGWNGYADPRSGGKAAGY